MKLRITGKWRGNGEIVQLTWENGNLSGFQPAIDEIQSLVKYYEKHELVIGETPYRKNLLENDFTFRHLVHEAFESPIAPEVGSSQFAWLSTASGLKTEDAPARGEILSIETVE